MNDLGGAFDRVLRAPAASTKPLAIVLAGHNGSGKSTMWREHLSDKLQIPLVNADRMMLSVLPEGPHLPGWASDLRDQDQNWMRVAQKGVESFVAQAMAQKVPFAMETVFSHWQAHPDGSVASKIQLIQQMQKAGYFVLLCFVGLSSVELSIARVSTRVALGGHAVPDQKLQHRFPRTQRAIRAALAVANAAILVDNSLDQERAFSVCRIQLRSRTLFDIRTDSLADPAVKVWLDVVAPATEPLA